VNPGFARLIVESGDDCTELDLGADARLFPAEPGRLALTLTGEELAVDKVLAVFGRAEARDFVDLMALEPRYGLERLCELAVEKDRGFTPALLGEMLGRFDRRRRDEFGLDDAQSSISVETSHVGMGAQSKLSDARSAPANAEAPTSNTIAERSRTRLPKRVRRTARAHGVPSPVPPSPRKPRD